MSDASDTFRLGLDAADRPEPSYPGDGIGDGQPEPTEPVLVTAPTAVAALVMGDLVTEIDTPDGPWYEVLQNAGGRLIVDARDEGDTVSLPLDLGWRETDRVLVRRPSAIDRASDTADLAIDPATVRVAPSGCYGFYVPAPARFEARPVVQVAQVIARRAGMEFHPTPARYYADQVAGWSADRALSIDHGQGWALSIDDTAALIAFAAGVDA